MGEVISPEYAIVSGVVVLTITTAMLGVRPAIHGEYVRIRDTVPS